MEGSVNICLQIVSFTIWIGLGIAMIVMGSIYKDHCSIQPYIPIFLLVTGVLHFVTFITTLLRLVCETFTFVLEGVIGIFGFAWFITGSIWVFTVYNNYKGNCDPNLYLFAFGILIFEYAVIALAVCCSCCCFSFKTLFYQSLRPQFN
ncbi:transmembrane protein 272-like [Rhinophrynus dorsalis]